ncbi:unnamed protein product [Macrosiphum euphorbiae]|uniref:Uncharacterized protein n=1 Tax=Macrosiphum euphorbiae TaxID=13131 RepID=A0AAV0XG90_9HEMI|nr:unnamed protein product [Macrosiphum euphorbiae]
MESHLEVSTCLQRSCQCASEGHRCVVDTLDLAVDSRIKAVCFPLRRRHFGESFRSSPELNIDSPVYSRPDLRSLQSPVLNDGVNTVVVAAASTSTGFPDFPVTAETKAVSLETQRPPDVRSLIATLDLAGCRTIPLAVGPPVRLGNARSCPELKMQSPVYGGVQNTVPTAPVEILARSEPRKSQSTYSESRCVVDTLDLAVDHRITGVCSLLRHRHYSDSFQSSPELRLDSPVYWSPELRSLQAPLLYDGVNTVQPEPAEMPQKRARSERHKSAFTRSTRFIWKGLVNAARRLCCCRTFVDME